jgi:hypothetical protein
VTITELAVEHDPIGQLLAHRARSSGK